ncbi:signal transduction histidine kinase/ActR/RegA family two-component response regulator [Caulobacter ginsengisoli]|uniref:histidine kinase n=1 Tax=Caulobacter ginsengisoli TaxID=400775 RepID=A0ABU0IU48_9CAUL|nr:ATP-binding protein [Caulobacter ginsengisoli]MDQ0464668.1 signal transduction histidine kinase/ActR/RegA family two-component response regulator [Caulobacter ginsengisoli]
MSTDVQDRFGLAGAVEMRRRHARARALTAMLIASGLTIGQGWWATWIWAGVFILVQHLEMRFAPRVLANPPRTASGAANAALWLFTPSAIAFGALSPILWTYIERYGPALGVTLIAGAMTNLVSLSRGSRVAFAVSALPYGLYLLVLPLLDAGQTAGPLLVTMMIAVGLVMLNVVGAWITTEDARRTQDEALAQAEEGRRAAEAATASKSAFVAMISHELRTPISAINAGAGELRREARDRGAKAHAQLIIDAGAMMRTLLDDLLDLAKLDAGRMEVEAIAFDPRRAVLDAVRLWKPQARAKGLRLGLYGARALPDWVVGDPTRLRQVLNNLFSNAIKFTRQGSVRLTVSVDGEMVRLALADTGPGMTADQINRLFTPFDQLDASVARKHGGSGLGLVISRQLARLMGGDLVASSAPGAGATFIVTLTLPPAEPALVEPAQPLGPPPRLLVVDDHAINRQAITLVLAPLGIVPETAASAEEGLERLAAEPFDIVLMDVYMPGMDGREATRRLRAHAGPNQNTPVIAITASATAKDWEACLASGMSGHVAKPIEPAQLYAALDQAISAARAAA